MSRPLALAALAVIGCQEDKPERSGAFATPAGMAQAGSSQQFLFVANADEDTLQVLDLAGSLAEVDFLNAPARFFALRVPVEPGPRDLVATSDGRYVVVLGTANDTLSVVEADTQVSIPASVLGLLGPPSAMVGVPACGLQGCVVDTVAVTVELPSGPTVQELGVSSDGLLLGAQGWTLPGGARPTQIAAAPDGSALYVADGAAPTVYRVDRFTGAVSSIAVDFRPGPLAVSTDGGFLLVGRPQTRDVLIFSIDAVGGVARLPVNPRFAPRPTCVGPCAGTPLACELTAHPADLALCVGGDGTLDTRGAPYDAIYVGDVPSRIVTLGRGVHGQALEVPCAHENGTELRRYDEFAVVAHIDGRSSMIGLVGDGVAVPELAERSWCAQRSPRFHVPDDARRDIDAVLDACPLSASAAALNRFDCAPGCVGTAQPTACDPAAAPETQCGGLVCDPGRVVSMPGHSGDIGIGLRWEGVLQIGDTFLDRPSGGGTVGRPDDPTDDQTTASTLFTDSVLDLEDFPVRAGDVLEIKSTPGATPDVQCLAGLGNPTPPVRKCQLERRIAGLADEQAPPLPGQTETRDGLLLAAPLPPACFDEDDVAYQVRAGDAFLVDTGTVKDRAGPGELFGPGGAGFLPVVAFRVNPGVATAPADPCAAYDDRGRSLVAGLPDRNPEVSYEFGVRDTFERVLAGEIARRDGEQVAGRVPGGMLVVKPAGEPNWVVFITYSADDSLLGFDPFNADRNRLASPKEIR